MTEQRERETICLLYDYVYIYIYTCTQIISIIYLRVLGMSTSYIYNIHYTCILYKRRLEPPQPPNSARPWNHF